MLMERLLLGKHAFRIITIVTFEYFGYCLPYSRNVLFNSGNLENKAEHIW